MRLRVNSSRSVRLRVLTYFQEPALSVRVEEGVCEVVPIVLWDFKRLIPYAVIQFLFWVNAKDMHKWFKNKLMKAVRITHA